VAVKCLSSNLLAGSSEGGSSAAGSAAAADLMQEASMLAALHHPNIVAVYGFVPPPQDMLGRCSFELPARPPQRTVSASAAGQGGSREVCGPAIVSEYMAAGSLHNALNNQAEWLKSSMAKVKVLLDTARVRDGTAPPASVQQTKSVFQCSQQLCSIDCRNCLSLILVLFASTARVGSNQSHSFLLCLQGLSYLHSKAVTHFDLKTANLLFTIKVKLRNSTSSWHVAVQVTLVTS
jgi:serine/threonine protein kinase